MEKANSAHSEILENYKSLQRLEQQHSQVQSKLELLRTQFDRDSLLSKRGFIEKFQQQLGHLEKGTQLLVASMRNIAIDISNIKKNLSHIPIFQS